MDHGHTETRSYLADRLDAARDLYLLALAFGARGEGPPVLGRMILEARIHFIAVIEECRIAGLDTGELALILGVENQELVDSIRPEMWKQLEQVLAHRKRVRGG